jgi:chemotaxis protein CheD
MESIGMGKMAVCRDQDEELFAIGLGSCIGLAVLDRRARVAGLAHIVLPISPDAGAEPGKFADRAVPELIDRMRLAGARPRRMEAVLVGGARMFDGGELDIGARNAEAVREALKALQVEVRAEATGGTLGRSIRVCAAQGRVTMKEVGGRPVTLLGGADEDDTRTESAITSIGGKR